MSQTILWLLGCVAIATADFGCLCGHGGSVSIYSSNSKSSSVIGTLHNGDCKALSDHVAIDSDWLAVDYHHQVGYVERTGLVAFSRCPGSESLLDIITTPGSAQVTTAAGSLTTSGASYACLCGHGGTVTVYPQKSTSSTPLGTISNNQCKAISDNMAIDPHWLAVDFHHQVGYVERTGQVSFSKCMGHPSSLDTVTTSRPGVQTTAAHHVTSAPSNSVVSGHNELCPHNLPHFASIDHAYLTQYGSSCYEIVPSLVSWSHAETNCKQKGGHLVSITSAGEQEYLYNYLDRNYNHTMWIGLHDRQHEEHFVWTSGEHVSYTNWAPGRKSVLHNYEDCAYMIPTQVLRGAWDDIDCGGDNSFTESFGEQHRFICEFRITSGSMILG